MFVTNDVTKVINKSLMKNLKNDFFTHKNFLTTTIISLYYCLEMVFILKNILMIGKNSMKYRYLKKKIFTFA